LLCLQEGKANEEGRVDSRDANSISEWHVEAVGLVGRVDL
jgi:hypothetical protein